MKESNVAKGVLGSKVLEGFDNPTNVEISLDLIPKQSRIELAPL